MILNPFMIGFLFPSKKYLIHLHTSEWMYFRLVTFLRLKKTMMKSFSGARLFWKVNNLPICSFHLFYRQSEGGTVFATRNSL